MEESPASGEAAEIDGYSVLNTGPEEAFDELVRTARRVCGVAGAYLVVRSGSGYWCKSAIGTERGSPAGIGLCNAVLEGNGLLETTNPTESGLPRFFAAVPLSGPRRRCVGALCVIDQSPRRLEPLHAEILLALAKCAADRLELALASRAVETERRRAEEAIGARSKLAAAAARELKAPVEGILAMAELLADAGLHEPQRQVLDGIKNSGRLLLAAVDSLFDGSRALPAGEVLQNVPFDPRRLLRQAEVSFSPKAKEKGIHFAVSADERLPPLLTGDSQRLLEILGNLLSNAVKFTLPGGSVTLDAVVGTIGRDAASLRFTVKDTGVGIPKALHSSLFAPRHEKGGGPKPGLSACASLVELKGGIIWVESEEGRGSSFHVLVSYGIPQPDEVPLSGPSAARSASRSFCPREGIRILLVEGEQLYREALSGILREFGFDAPLTADRRRALDLMRMSRFDLVFMEEDLSAPPLRGISSVVTTAPSSAPPPGTPDDGARIAKPFRKGDLLELLVKRGLLVGTD